MKESICTVIGITGSFIAGLFGGFDASMVTLIAFMGVDYVTGLILAAVRKSPKTDTGGSITTYYGKITRFLRINNAFLITVKYYQDRENCLVIPALCFIKSSDDMFFINMANGLEGGIRRPNSRYLTVTNTTSTWDYYMHSSKDGNGVKATRSISNYYHNLDDTASLVQMRCTNDYGTLIPGAYWVKKAPTRDTGIITINGKEYFSNGIFCILNE